VPREQDQLQLPANWRTWRATGDNEMPSLRHLLMLLLALALPQAAQAKAAEPSVRLEITARAPAFGDR
jgi:hypothetical protein